VDGFNVVNHGLPHILVVPYILETRQHIAKTTAHHLAYEVENLSPPYA